MLKLPSDALGLFAEGSAWRAKLNPKGLLASLVDEQWQPLLVSTAQLAAEARNLDVPLIEAEAGSTATAMGWDWSLSADANANVRIDALDAQEHSSSGVAAVPGQIVLRCTAKGTLGAGVAGSQKAGSWTFGLAAKADAQASIDWLISSNPMDSVALALSRAVRDGAFVAPMDLREQLLRADTGRFLGTRTTLKGGLSASARAAAAFSQTGWTWGLNGDRAQLGFTLGIEGEASLKLSGLFSLTVTPERRGSTIGIRVVLDRLNRSDLSLAASLSAGMDFSALARSADAFLRARLPDPTKVEKQIELLTNPASALKEAASKRIGALLAGEPDLANLAKLVLGVDPSAKEALSERLGDALTGHITDWLDRVATDGGSKLEDAQAEAIAWISSRLGGQALSKKIADAVGKAVADLFSDVAKQLDTAVSDLESKLVGQPREAVQSWLDGLGALGDKIWEELTAPLSKAGAQLSKTQAAKGIRAGLAAYSKLRQQVLKALGEAQRAKLLITFGIAIQDIKSVRSAFSGWFTLADDMTAPEALFRGLWRGHLDDLVGLIDAAERSGGLHEASGWLLRSFQSTRKASASVSLLGYTFSDTRIRTTNLDVRSDVNGNLIAVNGGAGAKAEIRNRWISRQSELNVTVEFRNPGKPTSQAVIELQGAFTAEGRDVNENYLRALGLSLRLMTQSRGTRDLRQLLDTEETKLLDDRRFWKSVSFLLPLSLSGDEWRTFAQQPEAVLRRRATDWGMRCLDQSLADDYAFAFTQPSRVLLGFGAQVRSSDPLGGAAAYLASLPDTTRVGDLSADELKRVGFEDVVMSKPFSAPRRRLETFLRLGRVCQGLVQLAEGSQRLQQIASEANGIDEHAVFERVRPVLKSLSVALAPSAVAGMTFTAKGEDDVPWPLVTLAATLSELSGRALPPGFVPVGVVAGSEARPVPLVDL